MRYLLSLLFFIPILSFSQSDFEKAEVLFRQQKYAQAQQQFERILRAEPVNFKVMEYLGDIQGAQKKWQNALAYYKKLKTLQPNNAEYIYKYGGVLGMIAKESNKFKALGMIGEVKSSFEKAIKLDPKHIEARWALIELYLQLPGILGGSEKKALVYANQLLKLSPVDGHLSKGHIHEYFERYAEAEREYKKAIELGSSKVCYQKLADLYKNKMDQPEKAKKTLAEFNEKNKS
ncbi:TRAP transporter TatT component family protein [Flavobacterium sp.]|uniref:tetratricopeptide repeat protein n=1 Tax=Flavobacterium sp. TaxID=239 RepID=UPI002615568E|nr:TRAP transporter TatT component family protein [Flavobacterium sp.]